MDKLTLTGAVIAYAALERAIAYDPSFADAYAALALNYAADYQGLDTSVLERWQRPPAESRVQALANAAKALSLDPELALPYLAFGLLHWKDQRYDEALRQIGKAAELAPNDTRVLSTHALLLTVVGEHHEALTIAERALRVDPKPPHRLYYVLGRIQFALRDYVGAIETLDRAGVGGQEFTSSMKGPHWFLAASYAYQGDLDKAAQAIGRVVKQTAWSNDHNLIAVRRISYFFRDDDDIAHYSRGLQLAGLPQYPYGFQPAQREVQRLRGGALRRLFRSGDFVAFRRAGSRKIPIRISAAGHSVWQVRHDLTDSSDVGFENDQVCFRLANYFDRHRLCFMVFRNAGEAMDSEFPDYAYRLIGAAQILLNPIL